MKLWNQGGKDTSPTDMTRSLETVKAALDSARHDLEDEQERTRALDGKLSQIAAFSGVSISITGAVGGSVVASGKLSAGFTIALGSVLGSSALLLLGGAVIAFRGLSPKKFAGVSEKAARKRLSSKRLGQNPDVALPRIAATYVEALTKARRVNGDKATAVSRAYGVIGFGFAGVVAALLVVVVGSVA